VVALVSGVYILLLGPSVYCRLAGPRLGKSRLAIVYCILIGLSMSFGFASSAKRVLLRLHAKTMRDVAGKLRTR
jgi:hypothetical protein